MNCLVCNNEIKDEYISGFCSKKCYSKWYYRKSHPIKVKTCIGCGISFKPKCNIQKFCCWECLQKHHRKKIAIKPKEKPCQICGKIVLGRGNLKYCKECKHTILLNRNKKLRDISCFRCGKVFRQKYGNEKFCSAECVKYKVAYKTTCVICQKKFLTKSRNQIYCSLRCRNKPKYNKRPNKNSNQPFIQTIGKCEVCNVSILEALEAHHYNLNNRIVLCGSCHNIWHKVSKDKYSTKENVIKTVQDILVKHQLRIGVASVI